MAHKADPNELIEVEFTGDHELELRDSEGSVAKTIKKGDKYTMKREQAEADANVTFPGKKDDEKDKPAAKDEAPRHTTATAKKDAD